MTVRRTLHIVKVITANAACLALCVAGGLSPTPAATRAAGAAVTIAAAAPVEPPENPADAGPADAQGADRWLRARLAAGPKLETLALPPSPPTTLPVATLVPTPYRAWMPPPVVPAAARASSALPPGGLRQAARPRPARDLPPVSDAIALVPPAPIRLAVPAAPRRDAPDPAVLAANAFGAGRGVEVPAATDDPTDVGVPAALVAAVPARKNAAAPLPVSPPDSAWRTTGFAPRSLPPDDDAPAAVPALPAPVTLPVDK